MISLNKTIVYTKNWKPTFWIALVLGMLLPVLLITLKPFDNSNSFSFKYLILSGYALCIMAPIILVHPIENYIYQKQSNRWFIANESIYIVTTLFLISLCSFFYHFYLISGQTSFSWPIIWDFIRSFCLPFIPILVPLWLYLRSKYGKIVVPMQQNKPFKQSTSVTIKGDNKTETLTILESDFVFAQAQQNYVDVYYNSADGLQQKMLRSTLSNIMKQLPHAWQVHRSYLVNLDYLTCVEGNARKRFMRISKIDETIPISQMYYEALNKRLSDSSQNVQL